MKVDTKSFLLGCLACLVGMGAAALIPVTAGIDFARSMHAQPATAQYASAKSASQPAPVQTSLAQTGAAGAQAQRVAQFENDAVKVWRTTVLPNAPLTMHRHEHPRVIIALRGGTMKIVDDTGASETHEWETGSAYWLTANPPGTHHADVNAGTDSIVVMVVELKKEP
jgi:quercetin dioxygenase-like cupin family protein